jgi:Cu/Ag efflux protein CusF
MVESFSIGVGVIGITSFVLKIYEMVEDFSLDWKDAPENVHELATDLKAIKVRLMEIEIRLLNDPAFKAAFESAGSSTLLSQLKTGDTALRGLLGLCQKESIKTIEDLIQKEKPKKLSWKRLQVAFE